MGRKAPLLDDQMGRKAPLLDDHPSPVPFTEGRLSDRGPSDRRVGAVGSRSRRGWGIAASVPLSLSLTDPGNSFEVGQDQAQRSRNETRVPKRTARKRGIQYGSCTAEWPHAESELERRLRTAARQSLGPDATAVEVDVVVGRTQQGPRRPRVGDDTYVRRLVKEETRRLEDAQRCCCA